MVLARPLLFDADVATWVINETPVGVLPKFAAAVFVDLTGCSARSALTQFESVESVYPQAPLVVCGSSDGILQQLIETGKRGMRAVVFVDPTRAPEYHDAARAQCQWLGWEVAERMTDPFLRRLGFVVVSRACDDFSVDDLAASVGLRYERLLKRLTRRHAALPHKLIVWGRLLYAAWVMQHHWRGLEQLARDLGWRADDQFESWTQSCIGVTPQDLLRNDAYEETRELFVKALG